MSEKIWSDDAWNDEVSGNPTTASAKMLAYQKMQKLRKQTAIYDISVSERDAALDEKYGSIRWSGGDDL